MTINSWGGMGWQPDLPDVRDYTPESDAIKDVLAKCKALKAAVKSVPPLVDLRKWCAPIESQGDLGSCTANAGVGLIEYYERRSFGSHLDDRRRYRRLASDAQLAALLARSYLG